MINVSTKIRSRSQSICFTRPLSSLRFYSSFHFISSSSQVCFSGNVDYQLLTDLLVSQVFLFPQIIKDVVAIKWTQEAS